MLSRVADSLYWMSRYLERAEHRTRLLDVNLDRLQCALQAIQHQSGKARAEELNRIAGRLSASLGFASVGEILVGVVVYLRGIQRQCQSIHETVYHLHVDYSIQAALAG